MPLNELRDARIATTLAFMMNGFGVGVFVAQLPDFKFHLGISNGALGSALFFLAAGVLSALGPGGRLCAKHGSSKVVIWGTLLLIVALPILGESRNYITFCAAAYLLGYAFALQDVSMNAHAVTLEQQFNKRVMSTFHGTFSIGALGGSAVGGIFSQFHVQLPVQEILVAILFALTLVYMKSRFLPDSSDKQEPRENRRPKKPKIFWVMGLLGLAAAIGEGSCGDWGGVLARTTFHATPFVSTLPYIFFCAAMVTGRFLGDRLAHRFGPGRLLFAAGLIAGVGLSSGLLVGGIAGEIFGWAMNGIGVSVVIPLIYSEAGTIAIKKYVGVIAPSEAVAMVSGIAYFGFVIGPPIMGYTSEAITLRWAMLIPAGLALLLAAGSRIVIRQEQ
jgi:fucose permease